jgi:hypothetical protein
MPAADEPCRVLQRPAYENLQGRKPRWGNEGRCYRRYGDLTAADAVPELRQDGCTYCSTLLWRLSGSVLLNEGALMGEDR